jgi:hypothetical protein
VDKDLDEDAPYVNFNFELLNLSVFSIQIGKSVDGWIEFAGRRLGGNLRRTDTYGSFSHRQFSWIVVTQWLSKEEVARIRKASDQCAFNFEHLEITIEGATDKFPSDTTVIKQPYKIKQKLEKAGKLTPGPLKDVGIRLAVEPDGLPRDVVYNRFAGTMGLYKPLKGFSIQIDPSVDNLSLEYKAHFENMDKDTEFEPEGTFLARADEKGKILNVQGFSVNLTGTEAKNYDIVYTAHLRGTGNLERNYKNGEFCGTRERAVEGMKVLVCPRGANLPYLL